VPLDDTVMSVSPPRSATWWAMRRSPAATPAGLVAVTASLRSAAVETLRRVGWVEPSETSGVAIDAAAAITDGAAVAPAETVGAGTDAAHATAGGAATIAVNTAGAGTLAVAATTVGAAAAPADVDGAGTDADASTTAGVAVADVAPPVTARV